MNLRDCRFDLRVAPVHSQDGGYVYCETIVNFITKQKQQFGVSSEKILELLLKELKNEL